MKIIVLLLIVTSSVVWSSESPMSTQEALRRFHAQPKIFMEEIPTKWSETGQKKKSTFPKSSIQTKSFLNKKDSLRQRLCTQNGRRQRCPTFRENNISLFLEKSNHVFIDEGIKTTFQEFFEGVPSFRNIRDIDKYRELEVAQKPWSDTYWPLYMGALGQRYGDPNFPSSDWLSNFNYVSKFDIFDGGPKDQLAPSEKYDFLLGDRAKTLTESMWNQGRYYYDSGGDVERWMGLCHGWAAASYMLARPTKSVEVTAADGVTKVKMYPSDIKALATLLWTSDQNNTLFVGGRCNDKSPPRDENGRIISSQCFDTNPGVWHLALINRIRQGKPFVFDASYDYEVWNQPVLGYSFKYVNPETMEDSEDLNQSVIPIENFKNDKFKKYRSSQSKFIVGISMEVIYLAENLPSIQDYDSPDFDSRMRVRYLYDLELNEGWDIIGGEWYHNAHPDFIWTPQSGTRAMSSGDYMIRSKWQAGRSVPANWLSAARYSSRESLPLANVVEKLIEWAQ
ncbi:MAG: hypothetical protein AB7F59_13380 [Bdellovibrionales bacterium]